MKLTQSIWALELEDEPDTWQPTMSNIAPSRLMNLVVIRSKERGAAYPRNAEDTVSAPSWLRRGTWQDPCRSFPCIPSSRSSTSAHRELLDGRRRPGRRSFRRRDRLLLILCSCCLHVPSGLAQLHPNQARSSARLIRSWSHHAQ